MPLYKFQEEGVKFLLAEPNRLLADDPGLGKSIQVCAAFKQANLNSILIICPAIHKDTWAQYLIDWAGFSSQDIQIARTGKDEIDCHNKAAFIINYELLLNKAILKHLLVMKFDVIVVDEAHRLKSIKSKTSTIMLAQQGKRPPLISRGVRKWLLSGTICPNRPIELFPILKTLAPKVIEPHTGWEDYGNYFCAGYNDGFANNFSGASHVEELSASLQSFMLRRQISQVYKELPDKIIEPIYCDLELNCSEADTPLATLRKMIGDAKLPFVIDVLDDKLANSDDKIVAIAYTRTVIESIADAEKLAKYNPVYVYGGMSQKDKQFALDTFIEDSNCRLIVLQIKSAGEALDGLQKVSNVIVFPELEWSAGTFDQAVGRLHRIGQTNIVRIYPIIAKNTLDESIIGTYHSKKRVINKLMSDRTPDFYRCDTPSCQGTNTLGTCKCNGEIMLEQKIEELTGAVNKLIAVLERETKDVEKVRAEQVEQPAEKKKPGRPPVKKEEAVAAAPKSKPANASNASSEDIVRELALKVIRECPGGKEGGRNDITKALKKCGAEKLADLKPEQFEQVEILLKAALNSYLPEADESDDLGEI